MDDDTSEGPVAETVIELENRTRSVYRFPVYKRVQRPGTRATQLVRQWGESLVLGDAADARIPDDQRTARCPNPVARVTKAQLEAIGEAGRRVLNSLVAKGDVRMREVAA